MVLSTNNSLDDGPDLLSECQRRILAERSFLLRTALGAKWKDVLDVNDTSQGISAVREIFLQKTAWISPMLVRRFFLLETALRKIDDGTFGICDTCREQIGEQRLLANPSAIYCITCQAGFESSLAQREHAALASY